jgi:hypothetical protein
MLEFCQTCACLKKNFEGACQMQTLDWLYLCQILKVIHLSKLNDKYLGYKALGSWSARNSHMDLR